MDANLDYNRIIWASRRGMLELDLVLEPFVRNAYRDLSSEDQARYRALLECEDQELFGWFLGRLRPEDAELAKIVDTVLAFTHRKA
ncbi:MAG: succinate dehydrogenase assembly factor 2 [Halieaceae bacterium]|jgi:antitoxin CptB|nr:succinate dehydrogenase assembly factor 2 [Halieaceae bacterium]